MHFFGLSRRERENRFDAGRKLPPAETKKARRRGVLFSRAADGIRTHDNHVGNVMLCQLSYSRVERGTDYRSKDGFGKSFGKLESIVLRTVLPIFACRTDKLSVWPSRFSRELRSSSPSWPFLFPLIRVRHRMSTSIDSTETSTEQPPLQFDVEVKSPQTCVRDVVVTIPEPEVKRYLKEAYDELVPEAQVPGFRSGRAPRRLVEKQFKDRVVEQVKGKLLMDALGQVTDTEEFSAISEPDFDYNSIPEPGEGPFVFQFSIEVRPEFKTPEWKGLKLKKPVEIINDDSVSDALNRVLRDRATFEATDDPAAIGDKLVVTIEFKDGDEVLSTLEEEQIVLAQTLSLSDAVCEAFRQRRCWQERRRQRHDRRETWRHR